MKTLFAASFMILLGALAACTDTVSDKKEAVATDYLVTIATEYGEMKAVLYDQTPNHKANFVKLARDGFYDGLLFHRVLPGFMIQGGDPESRLAESGKQLGDGGPGYEIPAEIVPGLIHVKGALAAARRGNEQNPELASSGSQFYIVQGQVSPREQLEGLDRGKVYQAYQKLMTTMPENELAKKYREFEENNPDNRKALQKLVMDTAEQLAKTTGVNFTMSKQRIDAYSSVGGTSFLDGQYTVFGQVIDGLDVIDKVAALERSSSDRPKQDVRMSISITELPKNEVSKLIKMADIKYRSPSI